MLLLPGLHAVIEIGSLCCSSAKALRDSAGRPGRIPSSTDFSFDTAAARVEGLAVGTSIESARHRRKLGLV